MALKDKKTVNVLIAGIAGASLGTEIFKALKLAGRYNIFGADISPYAFGLYMDGFKKTFVARGKDYVHSLLNICKEAKIDLVIPGGEKPLISISSKRSLFEKIGVAVAANSRGIIELCSDKTKTFEFLKKNKIPIPLTLTVESAADLDHAPYPCVLKPSVGSGGSRFLCIAENQEEAKASFKYLKRNSIKVILQEYIPGEKAEYTIGVLSLPNGLTAGSIALNRLLEPKLSVLVRTGERVISSGYSQGIIDDFKKIRKQAERIAESLCSKGPLNIQGRVKKGIFYPFEINPRFSASAYLRAMAGFNEVDIYSRFILTGKEPHIGKIRPGYYLRSFDEKFVSFGNCKTKK